jgi:hypothetical protein
MGALRSNPLIIAMVALLALVIVLVSPRPADAATAASDAASNLVWVAAPSDIGRSDRKAPATDPAPVLGSAKWAACGATSSRTMVIKTYRRVAGAGGGKTLAAGYSTLDCGNAKWGYFHIVKNQLAQWESDASYEGVNWRDLANWAIDLALTQPNWRGYQPRNNTFCYSHQIYLVSRVTGKIAATRWPTIIVGGRTTNVITAYPTSAAPRCQE